MPTPSPRFCCFLPLSAPFVSQRGTTEFISCGLLFHCQRAGPRSGGFAGLNGSLWAGAKGIVDVLVRLHSSVLTVRC